MARAQRWEYAVGFFLRKGEELFYQSSQHARRKIRGGHRGFADVLNAMGAEGWELIHVDDEPPRVYAQEGEETIHAWGDMIFKRPTETE